MQQLGTKGDDDHNFTYEIYFVVSGLATDMWWFGVSHLYASSVIQVVNVKLNGPTQAIRTYFAIRTEKYGSALLMHVIGTQRANQSAFSKVPIYDID